MKRKRKGFLVILLMFCFCTLLVACDKTNAENTTTDEKQQHTEEKWLLTYIKYTYENGEVFNEEFFDYDIYGRLTEHKKGNYESYDFCYDDNGLVVSNKFEAFDFSSFSDVEKTCEYEYDKNGNCISKTIVCADGSTENYLYYYNEYNDIIKEIQESPNNHIYNYKETIKDLIYENGMCIEAHITENTDSSVNTIVNTTSDGRVFYSVIEKYEYDENNNLSSISYYTLDTAAKNVIIVNDIEYGLKQITYYTYSKKAVELLDTNKTAISNNNSENQQAETTKEPKKLSAECDDVLISWEYDNDIYQAVANYDEDYSGLLISVGIIKNNKWHLNPSTEMPFAKDSTEIGDVYYIGNNCLLCVKSSKSNTFASEYYKYVVYNVSNSNAFVKTGYDEIDIPTDSDENNMIIGWDSHDAFEIKDQYTNVCVLNLNDMTTKNIKVQGRIFYGSDITNISEGCFSIATGSSNYPDYIFYDTNGNKILDLSEYKTSRNQRVRFVDGKCSLKIINNNDTEYTIVVDKAGNVLSSTKNS